MKKTKTFEESLSRLTDIVKQLESNTIELEASIALFEEGLLLSQECQKTLEHYQAKIQSLLDKNTLGEHDDETNL